MSVWSRGSPSHEKTGFTITHRIPAVRAQHPTVSRGLWITWGQPCLLSPESPVTASGRWQTAPATRVVSHRHWFDQATFGELSTPVFRPVDRCGSTASCAETAESARLPRTSVRQERFSRCENHRTLPQELSTLMIIVCSLADCGEMCPPCPDPGRSSHRDGQSRLPFHTTRQRTACAHSRLASQETSGVVRR